MLRLPPNTSIADINWRKQPNWQGHSELCNKNPDILGRVLDSNAGKWAPMQVIKQPEYGKTLTTKEQKTPFIWTTNYEFGKWK